MHSGITPIPEGWAICDGNTYTYNGITSVTPNLIGRFIKAVGNNIDVVEVNNPNLTSTNEFTLTIDHLPEHNHPHTEHTHTFTGTVNTDTLSVISDLSTTTTTYNAVYDSDGPLDAITSVTPTYEDLSNEHNVIGTINLATSEEESLNWTNKPINIEPNYYALIFIMKL